MDTRLENTNGGKISQEDMNGLLGLQIDASAMLGHANYDLSLRRRKVIKPTLDREYGSLCSSQIPVTSLLFVDDLQAQLNAIRATNRHGYTATKSSQDSLSHSTKHQPTDYFCPGATQTPPNESTISQLSSTSHTRGNRPRGPRGNSWYDFTP